MEELLNNPWVTGIGGGILSILIVFFLTRWLFSDQSNRELKQKIASANRDIIYAIRSGIPEGVIPSAETIDALRSATARRGGFPPDMLLDNRALVEELIKEVMDNSFISSKAKNDFCVELHGVMVGPHMETVEDKLKSTGKIYERDSFNSQARSIATISVAMSIMAGASYTMFTFVSKYSSEPREILNFSYLSSPEIFAVMATSISVASGLISILISSRTAKYRKNIQFKPFLSEGDIKKMQIKYREINE